MHIKSCLGFGFFVDGDSAGQYYDECDAKNIPSSPYLRPLDVYHDDFFFGIILEGTKSIQEVDLNAIGSLIGQCGARMINAYHATNLPPQDEPQFYLIQFEE